MSPDHFSATDQMGLRVKLMDFQAGLETVTTEFTPASHSPGSASHVAFLLDAPVDYQAGLGYSTINFFLDREPVDRDLGSLCFQLIYAPSRFASDFRMWADQVSCYVRECLFATGIVCVDFADFRTALDASRGTQLVVDIISIAESADLLNLLSTSPRFKTLYSNILGGVDLSLSFYQEVSEALEIRSPQLVEHKLGMKLANVPQTLLVLLGEPA
ncbi:hypothetical protein [Pseudomonas sp. URMO17WK12:I4]|uniref:hypothetical protein n=1 Tax=Pseudomonas sp. URMO17WK12:I4 TaxID=1283292 RepID=UPI000487B166|nr:hypothetical protein [Pseudomonas sp. URMO17WK12:I4]